MEERDGDYGGEAKNIAFLWNVMDRKTRFLLASKLSTFRDVAGADRAFREAMRNAKGSSPRESSPMVSIPTRL